MPVFQQVASFLSFKHQFAAKQFVNLQNEGQRNGIDLPRHRNKTHLKLNHPKHVGIQRHWECMCIWIYTNYSTGDWEGDISSSDQVSTCPYCWSLWPLCLNVHLYLQYIVYCLFIVCFFSQTLLVSVSISSPLSIRTIHTTRVDMGCAVHEKNTPLPTSISGLHDTFHLQLQLKQISPGTTMSSMAEVSSQRKPPRRAAF